MTDITIIGTGNMARAVGTRAVAKGFQLLVMALQANPAYKAFNWGTGLKILD